MAKRFLLVLGAALLLTGCRTIPKAESFTNGLSAEGTRLFLTSCEAQSKCLTAFLASHPEVTEKDKIQYLLAALRASDRVIIRNGKRYDGLTASGWFRWKSKHPQYKNDPIITAWDFVNRVTNGSKRTGKPYGVLFAGGHYETLQAVLTNELMVLEAAVGVRDMGTLPRKVQGEHAKGVGKVSYSAMPVSAGA